MPAPLPRLIVRLWPLLIILLNGACLPAATPPPQAAFTATSQQATATRASIPTSAFTSTQVATSTARPTAVASATPSPTPTETPLPVTTLLFTGVIVPARCVQAALDANGNPDYPYEEVRHIIQAADLAIGTFNATMSHRVEHTGCQWTFQLVGSPDNADALQRAGFDVMSVATNHIKDCGLMKSWCDYTFFDTLENLRRVGILTVGAGKNLDEALQPVVVTINGIRFGFIALGDSKMDVSVFAGPDHPGIAELNEENFQIALQRVRPLADVIIALPHWGSEDNLLPNWLQRNQARYITAAGVDLVVGNHTHVVQAIQEVNGVLVFYGLGNFVFDQGLRDHRQGVILLVHFTGTQISGYELIPTHTDQDGRVHLADAAEAAEILQRVEEASQQLK